MKLTCLSAHRCKICIQINVLLGCGLWLYPHNALQEYLFPLTMCYTYRSWSYFWSSTSSSSVGSLFSAKILRLSLASATTVASRNSSFVRKICCNIQTIKSFDTLYYCLEYEHVLKLKGKVKCKTFKTTPVHNIFNSNRETRR